MGENPYQVLGVSEDASYSEIISAYRERVKETHPDVNEGPDADEEFIRVKRAYTTLISEMGEDPYDESSRYYHERWESTVSPQNERDDGTSAYSDEAFEAVYRVHERTSPGLGIDYSTLILLPGVIVYIALKEYFYSYDTFLYGLPFAWLYYFSMNFAADYGSLGPYAILVVLIALMLFFSRVGVFTSGTVTIYLAYSSWNSITGLSIISVAQAFHLVPVWILSAMLTNTNQRE